MKKYTLAMAALLPVLGACDNGATTPRGSSAVSVQFNAVTSSSVTAARMSSTASQSSSEAPATGPITITGTNGTLVIDDLRLIVSRIKLKRAEGDCGSADSSAGCKKFDGGPFLVNLLDGTAPDVVTAGVPAGNYTSVEFKARNLDPADDNEAESAEHTAEVKAIEFLIVDARKTYPNFPRAASLVAHGTFTANGGTPQPFTVYFKAEITVKKSFDTAFKVPEDSKVVVNIDPSSWFKRGTAVVNLFDLNGKTVGFEAEFENGIRVEKKSN